MNNAVESSLKVGNVFKERGLYDRGREGFEVYARGMDASMSEKAKFLPHIKEGLILEMGCGNGAVLELLSAYSADSQVVGVDISDIMLRMALERDYSNLNVSLKKGDVTKLMAEPNSVDSVVFCSIMHEVFSYNGYDVEAVEETLANAYNMLRKSGRVIIRDGPRVAEETVYLKFKNLKTYHKFVKFAHEFGPYSIDYEYLGDSVRMKSNDAREFLSKYIYEKNWDVEVKEQFGVYDLDEWKKRLEAHGFEVVHQESYLIDWLRKTHYEKDVDMYEKKNDVYVRKQYPDSTIILVGEKKC